MPDRLTIADVERIASLARLELTDAEKALYTRQIGDILAYAEQVQGLDTTNVPPTAHVLSRHPTDRPDLARSSLPREAALANAPDGSLDAGLFRVPRVIGG